MTVTSSIVNKDAYDELVESSARECIKRKKAEVVELLSEQYSDFDNRAFSLMEREIRETMDRDVKYADAVAYLYFSDNDDVDETVYAGVKEAKKVVVILGMQVFENDLIAKINEFLEQIGDNFDDAFETLDDESDSAPKAAAESAFEDVIG